MSKRIILAGGGTGGHIYPAIAIATGLRRDLPDANILFIGSDKGLEKDLVPKAGFELKTIRIKGFKRKLSLDTLSTIKELALGMMASWKIIAGEKPDLVIGTGGYVAGPVLFLASLSGIKTLIHEQNVKPGVTNKILSRFVDKIAISFEESHKYFPKKKTILTGNPVRSEIAAGNRSKALVEFGLNSDLPVVLCFGGSQGALRLNDAMVELISDLKDEKSFQIIHITGKGQYSKVMGQLGNKGILLDSLGHIKILPYVYNMQNAYAAADLVISRAGALTVSEISMCGKPSILVPLHTAAGNHQNYNAKHLKDHGAAVIIQDHQLSAKTLREAVEGIVFDRRRMKEMARASKELAKFDALEILLSQVKSMLQS
jgi:UDP-N-acetylglucosamine--N-acetylmuramyl-(pentapeptide) pyrophosphoryl-undecaprenol N-acetylglucosamine transferase